MLKLALQNDYLMKLNSRFATFNELMMVVPDDPKFTTDNNDSYNHDKTLLNLTELMRDEGIFHCAGNRLSV